MRAPKTFSLLLILIFLFPATGVARNVAEHYGRQHRAEHWIVTEDDVDAYGCTATAIGPHALLTAEHCDMKAVDEDGNPRDASPILFFVDPDGKPDYLTGQTPYKIEGKIFDHSDHMILLVSGPAFKDTAEYETAAPKQGEDVFWFGNPGGIRDQFREGYVTGTMLTPPPFQTADQQLFVVAAPSIPGDSGSAVYDAHNGKLVGIVTYGINGGIFMGMYSPHFSAMEVWTAQFYDGRAL